MTYSLDTSAVLRILLNDPKRLAANVAMFIINCRALDLRPRNWRIFESKGTARLLMPV